jgi:hypothetical protein
VIKSDQCQLKSVLSSSKLLALSSEHHVIQREYLHDRSRLSPFNRSRQQVQKSLVTCITVGSIRDDLISSKNVERERGVKEAACA